MSDAITFEESFEYSLHNFLQWLEIMTLQPAEACEKWGNYNVAWELVTDLKIDGGHILDMACSYLSEDQKLKVAGFLEELASIPQQVLVGATSVAANQEAMAHSCWVPFRVSAQELLQVLEPAALKNREYFSSL